MKILLTEDNDDKRKQLVSYICSLGVSADCIVVADTMAEFAALMEHDVDICIIDLRIPAYQSAPAEPNGLGILEIVGRLGSNKLKLLAISSFPEEFSTVRPKFEARGCILADFENKDVWQSALKLMIFQTKASRNLDFIVFCALRKERSPYLAMPNLAGNAVSIDNLTLYDVSISGAVGTIVELPNMGLVDAAITAGLCIERFNPKLVAMSGICAGFLGRAELGQLLIADVSYEYQSGKWTEDGFVQKPYQASMSENIRALTRSMLEDSNLLSVLETGWTSNRPAKMTPPVLSTFTTGSAVIADERHMTEISGLHQKVSGLDMEIFAIQRAAHLAKSKPEVICAKTVVDLGSSSKGDELQDYGSFVSAQFIVKAIEKFFSR